MLCHGQERSGGAAVHPPWPAMPRGSPPRAAGDKAQKAGTENQKKPFSAQTLVCQTGTAGSSSRGAGIKEPRATRGGLQHTGPTIRPLQTAIPTAPTNHSCNPPDAGRMGTFPGLTTLCCDLLISDEIKPTRHEQSPREARPAPTRQHLCAEGQGALANTPGQVSLPRH